MPGPNAWMSIPTTILDLGQKTADAESWAAAQRATLAETWANVQRQAVQTMADTWQKGTDTLDHFTGGYQGAQDGATGPTAPPGYNDMAGASSSGSAPAFGVNPQDVTSPIDQARNVVGASSSPSPFTSDWPSVTVPSANPAPQPLPQLLGGDQPLTDLGNQIVQGQQGGMADFAYRNDRTPPTRADQPAREQIVRQYSPTDIQSGYTPSQLTAQAKAGADMALGTVSGVPEGAGDALKPLAGDVTAAVSRWDSLNQIARKLGVDLSEHNHVLDLEKGGLNIEHAAGSPEHNAATADLHNSYTASTAADLKATVVDKLGQAQEQLSGMREALDPAMVDAYKKYYDPNTQGLRSFSVKEWQDQYKGGNKLVMPPDNILVKDDRFPNQRRIGAEHMLDRQADALGFPVMNDFERQLGKVGKQLNQIDALKGQVSQLTQTSKQITSLQNGAKGLPDVAGGGPAASGSRVPLSDRMTQFLKESQGTPEETARIAEKIGKDAKGESDVLLKHLPENVRPYMTDVAGQYGENFAGRRRGVVHDDEAAKNAVTAAAGMSIESLMKTPAGKAFNDSEILALGSTLNHMGQQLDDLTNAKKIGVQLGRWTSQQEEKLARSALEYGVTASLFRGSQAEAGRALRAFNQVMGGESMINVKAIGRAAERFGIKAGSDLEATHPSVPPDVGGANRPGAFKPPTPTPPPSAGGEVNPIFRGDTASGFTPNLLPEKPTTANPFEKAQGFTPDLLPGKPETANPFAGAANTEAQAKANLGVAKTGGMAHEELLKRAFAAIGTDSERFHNWVQAWQATPASDFTNRYKLLQALYKAKPKDYVTALAYSGMLSNPSTHIANSVSNTVNALMGPVERLGAAVVDAPLARLQGRPQGRFAGEAKANAYGLLRGIPEGVQAGIYALKNGFSASTAIAAKGEVPRAEVFRGPIGAVVNAPSRLLTAADALMQPILLQGAKDAEIFRKAASEGLKGSALTDRIVELTQNTPEDLLDRATKDAEYRLYRQAPKTLGKSLIAARGLEVAGMEPLRFVIPFVQVPINATKYGLERSPLGFLNPDLWKNLAKKDPAAADNIARAGIGSLIAAGLGAEIGAGNLDITGAAPTDPTQRDAFYRQGKLPFALKIGDRYYSYQRWEPFNHPLTQVAAAVDAIRQAKAGADIPSMAGQAALTIAQNISTQTFLSGIGSLMQAVSDPTRYGESFVAQLETSAIPYSSAMRATANTMDPRQRSPQGIVENVENVTPGLSRNVPSRLNNYGEEQGIAGSPLLPYKSQTANDSPLEMELARLRVEPGAAGKSVRGIDLTRQENQDYQRLSGGLVKAALTQVLNDPRYRSLDDTRKAAAFTRIIGHAKDLAAQRFIGQLAASQGKAALLQRIAAKKRAQLPKAG